MADGTVQKHVAAVLDFGFNLAPDPPRQPWLVRDEIVTQLAVTADPGITVANFSVAANLRGVPGSLLVAWLSGGTAGQTYNVTYVYTTNKGRTDQRTLSVQVV